MAALYGCVGRATALICTRSSPWLPQQIHHRSFSICRATNKKYSIDADLAELQQCVSSAAKQQEQQKQSSKQHGKALRQDDAKQINRLLSSMGSKGTKMSVGQLCRLAFLLTRLKQSPVSQIKPLWQSVLRRLVQLSTAAAPALEQQPSIPQGACRSTHVVRDAARDDNIMPSTSSTHSGSSRIEVLLRDQASAGDVLYLLRALSAWCQDGSGSGDVEGLGDPTQAFVAAARSKAHEMNLQELMLCITALAQLSYYDPYLMATASQAFASAVAAAGSSTSAAQAASSVSCKNTQQQLQQQLSPSSKCQLGADSDVLPNIRDMQLVINYLWANASLGYSSPLLLHAALQLLLTGGQVQRIGKSHLPLCMWAISALLVCMLHAAAQDVPQEPADLQQDAAVAQHQRQNSQQQLIEVVHGVHHLLAAQAYAWWLQPGSEQSSATTHGSGAPQGVGSSASKQQQRSRQGRGSSSSSSSRSRDVPAFSVDSRRQMYQAHVWLQAACAAGARATSTTAAAAAAAAAAASASGVTTGTATSINHGSTQLKPTTGAAAAAQAEAVGSTPGVRAATAAGEAAAAHQEAGLLELQAVLQQQQQQQQQQQLQQQQQPDVLQLQEHQGRQGDRGTQMATFWDFCGAAWSSNTPQVSLLQQQVFEALQSVGLQPRCEFPAQPLQEHAAQHTSTTPQHHTSLAPATKSTPALQADAAGGTLLQDSSRSSSRSRGGASSAAGCSSSDAAGVAGECVSACFLSVDIACVMPMTMLQEARQHGLKAALYSMQQQEAGKCKHTDSTGRISPGYGSNISNPSSSSSSPASDAGKLLRTQDRSEDVDDRSSHVGDSCTVLVAVEVDGPTHVAVNCASHALGATACRNWLLQQWGWQVLVVPWWECQY